MCSPILYILFYTENRFLSTLILKVDLTKTHICVIIFRKKGDGAMFGTTAHELKKLLNNRKYALGFLAFVTVTVIAATTLLSIKTVTVNDGGNIYTVKSFSNNVEGFIKSQKIKIGEFDVVSPSYSKALSRNQDITIERAFGVTLNIGTESANVYTVSRTVRDVLALNGTELSDADIVNPALDSVVTEGTVITVTKVTSDMIYEEAEIPFETVSVANSRMSRGEKQVKTEGVNGVKKLAYSVVYHDGIEQSRELVGEQIITDPVTKVVEYGTKYVQVSRGGARTLVENPGESLNYSSSVVYTATAYSGEGCGSNVTASGMPAVKGVVAVDRRYIPFGTKMYIESLDGTPDYGYAVAGDTGGAIKGNIIDLCMNSHREALNYGRRRVRIYFLNE